MAIKTKTLEYLGRPCIVLEWDNPLKPDPAPFSLGIGRCKKVLEAHEEIKAFVALHKNDRAKFKPKPEQAQASPFGQGLRDHAQRQAEHDYTHAHRITP